ncbi:MAG: sugar ABC transporter permease [Actinomycetota bacterium]
MTASATDTGSPAEESSRAPQPEQAGRRMTMAEGVTQWRSSVASGDIGSLPVVLGLAAITIIFQAQNSNFLSAQNITNLILQLASIALISTGIVFVLLIGEIDLSVAATAGVGAMLIARLVAEDGNEIPWLIALAAAAVAAAVIGLTHGYFVAKLGVPSLIVTLATFFVLRGLVQGPIAGGTGLIRITDPAIVGVANEFLSPALGWVIGIAAVVAYAAVLVIDDRATIRQGLVTQSTFSLAGKIVMMAVLLLGLVAITNADRGLPLLAVILGLFVVGWTVVAERTRFGRHVYAVGGNAEAARRAGIDVDRIKMACFVIGAVMAAVGGLVVASRLRSADNAIPVSNLLLNSIAAAVIGGCSLFGGRGRVVNALQGALVIGAVESGMGLLGWPSDRKFMVTGVILLLAVTIDTVTRRARQTSGRG